MKKYGEKAAVHKPSWEACASQLWEGVHSAKALIMDLWFRATPP